jgi:hypothetical protein
VILKVERDAPERGPLALGRVTLSSTQPLGLWRAWSYVHFPLAGVVYPEPEPGRAAAAARRARPGPDAPGQGEESEFAGLREYHPGDPLQRVAWKAGRARRGLVHQGVRRRRRRRPGHARLGGLPHALDAETRLSRLTAWVLASERAARPFALRIPAARCRSRTTATTVARRSRCSRCSRRSARDRAGAPRARARDASPRLTATQIRWLGALLLLAQLPQAPHLPLWIAAFGMLLVGLRFALLRRDRSRPDAPPARIPSWTLVIFAVVAALFVRASYGYLLGRDPSVAFLFILVGIKFLRRARCATARCWSRLLRFSSSRRSSAASRRCGAGRVAGAARARRDARRVVPHPGERVRAHAGAGAQENRRMILQGIPIAAVLFVLFPRIGAPLWGMPADAGAQTGLSDSMAPGSISELSLSDAVAFRVDFDGVIPPTADRYWRGPVLGRFDGREWSMVARPGNGRWRASRRRASRTR